MTNGGHDDVAPRDLKAASASGLLFVAFAVAAAFMADLPSIDSQAVEVADYFDAEHVEVVTSVYLQGVALACFLFFVAGLATRIRKAGEEWLAATLLAASGVLVALLGFAATVLAALAYRATDDASVAQSLFDLTLLSRTFASFPLAVLVAATGLAVVRAAIFPRWYGWATLTLTVLFLAAAATYGDSGFFAPDGGYSRASSLLFLAWVVVTSGLLIRTQTFART